MSQQTFDTDTIRMQRYYTGREYALRIIWGLIQPFFRYSPRVLYGWRVFLLRLLGAKIGRKVHIYPSARIMFPWNLRIGSHVTIAWGVQVYNLGPITIGDHTIISQFVHLCAGTHDYRKANFPLLKPPISIGAGVWIAADAFIGPGVMVGAGAVVAARAVVVKDVAPQTVVGGHPAGVISNINI